MKFREMVEVREALMQLGQEKLPIAYEIAKNLRIVTRKIELIQKDVHSAIESLIVKDENGKSKIENGKPVFKSAEDEKLYDKAIEVAESEDHVVDCHKIALTRLEGRELKGVLLAPLLDIIFVPTQAEVDPKLKQKE